jgi:osmoprotectant transport system ATP-binding protein
MPDRWIDERSLDDSTRSMEKTGRAITFQLQPEDTLQDALSAMLQTSTGMAVVVDGKNNFLGCVTIDSLAQLLVQTQSGAA